MVVTEDPSIVKRDFITKTRMLLLPFASMPSFNDDEGYVLILNGKCY